MEAARRTEGFSGRELAKLMASVQAAAYGTPNAKLSEEVPPPTTCCSVSRVHECVFYRMLWRTVECGAVIL